jgi:Tol biopolymer transport system component
MTDPRTLLEREIERVEPPTFTLDGFHRRRDRRRRNERIAAGGVALAIAAAGLAFAMGALHTLDTTRPVAPVSAKAIVFLEGGRLMVVSPDGGAVRPLIDPEALGTLDGPGSCPPSRCGVLPVFAWSPDGTQVVFAWNDLSAPLGSVDHRWDMLYAAGASGTWTRFVTSCGAGSPGGICTDLAWSPDGDLAFTADDGVLWLGTGSGASNLATGVIDFAWSPDGNELAYLQASGEVRVTSASPQGGASTFVADVTGGPDSVSWSPDGAALLVTSSSRSSAGSDLITTIDRESGDQSVLVRGGRDRFLSDATWSPDGRLIAWAAFPGRESFGGPGGPFEAEIWVANTDGSDAHRVYATGCCVAGMTEHAFTGPSFSPDGRSIAFGVIGDSAGLPNDNGIYLVNVDGGGLRQVSPTGILPAWQPLPREG